MSQSGDTQSTDSIRLRASVVAAKAKLVKIREKLRKQHESGSTGKQVCAHLTDIWDGVVLEIFERAVQECTGDDKILADLALVPHGGYGRRDVAPFSDLDLMLLHRSSAERDVGKIARRLVADISDVGIELGFSVRTARQAVQMARRDPVIFTSQVEGRFLAGSVGLYSKFIQRFRRDTKRRVRTLLPQLERARNNERLQFGDTTYLLEPDIKRSVGGLRDLHFLRWIGFARFGEPAPDQLCLMGILSKDDERALRRAHDFLLRLRNEMHFHKGRLYDVLDRGEQMRIARKWGYSSTDSLRDVELFMSDYFRHTSNIRVIVYNFISSARMPSVVMSVIEPIIAHRMDENFMVGPTNISATKAGLRRLTGNLSEVIRLMVLANQTDKRIAPATWKAIRDDMTMRTEMEVSQETARRFMALLSYTARLGRLLRRLHELRVLEKLVVGMDHARYLLQFNQYHKYTVDEHSFQCVERATEFFTNPGILGKVYRSLRQRDLLHLALLIHDLGKGYEEDHSVVGGRLAEQTGLRLHLPPKQRRLLKFLVEKHLLMSHLAFRRDTGDQTLIHQFAGDVGSQQNLKLLYVMTAADLAGVGPGVLNPWKVDVLTKLYLQTMEHLGGETETPDVNDQAESVRRQVLANLPDSEEREWYTRQAQALPTSYLANVKRKRAMKDLGKLSLLRTERAVAWGRYSEKRNVNLYNVGLHESDVYNVFHRLIGVLTQNGMQILAAYQHLLADKSAMLQFFVEDHDYQGAPPKARFESVAKHLVDSVKSESDGWPAFRTMWRRRADQTEKTAMPIRVEFDNITLPTQTIIDIFAFDRVDLMYTITRLLHRFGARVHFFKCGPYLDQVVDVFYVTDNMNNKIEDDRRLNELRMLLLTAIGNE